MFRFLPASTPYWRPRLREQPCSLFWKPRGGKRCYAYAMGNHPELQKGAKLYHVEKRMVKKDNVVFYLLDSFEVIQQKDAA